MKTVGIADLKTNLSGLLEKIKAGGQIIVTNRGRPVAKLVPLESPERRMTRRERLTRSGLLLPGRGKVRKTLLSPPRGKNLGKGVLAALLAEREENR
jgi:prevent-host-death family protein